MEKNIKVITVIDYHDIKLDKDVPKNKVDWYDEDRARELYNNGIIKILEIRKCIYEPDRPTK